MFFKFLLPCPLDSSHAALQSHAPGLSNTGCTDPKAVSNTTYIYGASTFRHCNIGLVVNTWVFRTPIGGNMHSIRPEFHHLMHHQTTLAATALASGATGSATCGCCGANCCCCRCCTCCSCCCCCGSCCNNFCTCCGSCGHKMCCT